MLDIVKCELILCRLLLKNVWRLRTIYKTNQPKFCCIPRPQSPDIRCFFFYLVHTTGALYDAAECVFFFIINNISDARVSIRQKKEVQAETDTQTKFPFTILILDNVFFFFFGTTS